jgi:hypothetical protein
MADGSLRLVRPSRSPGRSRSAPLPFRDTPTYPVWGFLIATVCGSCPIVWSTGRRALGQLPARRPFIVETLGYGVWAVALIVTTLVVGAVAFGHVRPVNTLPYLPQRFEIVYLAVAVAPSIMAMSRLGGASLRGHGRAADLVAWRAILQSQLAALGAHHQRADAADSHALSYLSFHTVGQFSPGETDALYLPEHCCVVSSRAASLRDPGCSAGQLVEGDAEPVAVGRSVAMS